MARFETFARRGAFASTAGRRRSQIRNRLTPNELKPEAQIVVSAIGARQQARQAEVRRNGRVRAKSRRQCGQHKIAALLATNRERQTVTARFAHNPKIGAGAAPFRAVRRNPAPAGPRLGEQVRQLVTQRPIDLRVAVCAESAIEEDARVAVLRAAGRGTETRWTIQPDFRAERGRAVREEQARAIDSNAGSRPGFSREREEREKIRAD